MFYNNINPVLLELGPFEIRYYGLVYVLGFILAFFVLDHYRKKKELKLEGDDIYDLMIYIVLGVIIGSRVFHILFWDLGHYLSNPVRMLMFWEGGMAFHGGLVGVLLATWLYCRKKKLNVWRVADILAIPALIMLAIGRLANYTNHELYGPVTDASWCVVFDGAEGCRHPYQFYSFFKRMAVVAWLWYLMAHRTAKKFKDGFVFWNLFTWVNLGRFAIDFWREDSRLLGLAAGQYLALVLFVIGVVVLLKYYKKDLKKIF
ncbi:prolipoprotein diacylglyceryl transferase [Thermoproteota archaeon]